MFGLWRRRTFEDPQLGRFTRVRTMWYPAETADGLQVSLEGSKDRPSPESIEMARNLLDDPSGLIRVAVAFVRENSHAQEFIEGNGELVCDGFTVYESGKFTVDFSLAKWPDAMIRVPFKDGAPCDVVLDD